MKLSHVSCPILSPAFCTFKPPSVIINSSSSTHYSTMAKRQRSPSTFISLFPLLLLLLLSISTVEGTKKSSYGLYDNNNHINSNNNKDNSVKLFVFGDSYVDTGNFVHSGSYKPPYGITFPGQPAGRFSDGRVLTDYVASYLKIQTPTPSAFRNSSNQQYGINFAYGGTGIFDTLVDGPNMTVQIDSFEKLIQQNVYTKTDLESSVALVNAGGNDYTKHIKDGGMLDIPEFTRSLVKQMSLNLKRIQSLGVGKVAVGLLGPIGCLPVITSATLHQSCIDILNSVSRSYSQQLQEVVQELNMVTGKTVFVALDTYNTFLSTIDTMKKAHDGNSTLMNPLQQCCVGSPLHECGYVDDNGEKKYSVCENPGLSFYWDSVHPSQNGWNAVFTLLKPSLGQLTQKNF